MRSYIVIYLYISLGLSIRIPSEIIKRNVQLTVIDKQTPIQYTIQNNTFSIDVQSDLILSVGSGFILDTNHILTNYHVVNKTDTIILVGLIEDVKKSPINQYIMTIHSFSTYEDVAILHTRGFMNIERKPFAYTKHIDIGDDLYVFGFPIIGGDSLTLTKGIISGYIDNGRYLKTDAELNPGNSGGIVLNKNLEIVGLSTAIIHNEYNGKYGLIIPFPILNDFIKSTYPY